MNGVYTNLAKKRAEQSKKPANLGDPPPPPETPIVPETQGKTDMPARLQTRRRAKLSLAPALPDSEMVEKYTTHVEPSLIKKIKLAAIEKDIKDYDVVRAALNQYFENNK
jgi:hypothetical protein